MNSPFTQIAEEEIQFARRYHEDAIQFQVTAGDLNQIGVYLFTGNYKRLMYEYGHKFLLSVLDRAEREERYLTCASIKLQIEWHNKLLNDNLPTQ